MSDKPFDPWALPHTEITQFVDLEKICKNLPDGYGLTIELESGYCGVFLELPDGTIRGFGEDASYVHEQLDKAIKAAQGKDEEVNLLLRKEDE